LQATSLLRRSWNRLNEAAARSVEYSSLGNAQPRRVLVEEWNK